MTAKPLLLAGRWRETGALLGNDNPSDLDRPVGTYCVAAAAEVEEAIAAGQRAFPAWRDTDPQTRADILERIGVELIARCDELGRQLSEEQGKILPDGIAEVKRAGQIFKFYGGEALRLDGDSLASLRPRMRAEVRREPLGLVAAITPWNFPIGVAAWKVAPALACGNCVMLKPSELAPASAWSLAEIIQRAGLPPGVFQLLVGGPELGEALVARPELAGITFTGSTATGRRIAAAAAPHFCRLQLEMGGKNPLIVLADGDIELAVTAAFQGAFLAAGQRCTATSRIIVARPVLARFVEGLVARMKAVRVGHALASESEIGPVIDARQMRKNQEYIALGKSEGAELVQGGEVLTRSTRGHYLAPALFVGTHNGMRINREEIFGPIAAVIPAEDYDEALALANDCAYGLTAALISGKQAIAEHFKQHVETGLAIVNGPTVGADYHAPFGGRKDSSYGWRETGRVAKDFFTLSKTIYQGGLHG
ncbi:MAG TPA: aldehyde dehydrogenase family protein [Dongiaceae bacterium]|jgi:aldehyde dehydrogenase (NAD+)|nr:aldehyde dehydrogenase family protein [Dongiaceae bacterium]